MQSQNWSRKFKETPVLPVARYLFPDVKSLVEELFARNKSDARVLKAVFEGIATVLAKLENAAIAVREIEIGGPIVSAKEKSITGQALLDLSQDLNQLLADQNRFENLGVYMRAIPRPVNECEVAIRRLEEFAALEIVTICRGETNPAVVAIVEGSVRCFGRVPGAVFACKTPRRKDLISFLNTL